MARQVANDGKQKAYWGQALASGGTLLMLADVFAVSRPLWEMASQIREGLLGVVPAVGVCLLNATNALAFHRVDYFWFASHILVLSCAMTALIGGVLLLRPARKRTFVFELALVPEWQGRETINNGSR